MGKSTAVRKGDKENTFQLQRVRALGAARLSFIRDWKKPLFLSFLFAASFGQKPIPSMKAF